MTHTGKLYIVATPIGNSGDITLRAIETFKMVDIICAEDTRMAKKLLSMYEIEDKKVYAVNEFADASKIQHVIQALEEGKNVAFSSDAGTPGISDPGALLVSEARKVGVSIVPIPGVSAVATAMSVAGIRETPFMFYGFLPHKKGRQKILDTLLAQGETLVLYESPHRFMKLLSELKERMSDSASIEVTVCRELTKIYEDVRVGSPDVLIEHYTENDDQVRQIQI